MRTFFLTARLRALQPVLYSCLFFLCLAGVALAQPNLTVDNTAYSVAYSGSYQDFTVPGNAARIILNLKGGDGGKAQIRYADCCAIDNTCYGDGGAGATVRATFAVGMGPGKIPPGSIIRFIIGGAGATGNTGNTFLGWETGGGGGGTGILFKAPGAPSFTPLTIAGAGGGAYRGIVSGICTDQSEGGGGNYASNGDGGGGDIASGGGGTNGNGGGGNELAGGGGGGYLSDGDGVTCVGLTSSFGFFSNEAGEGHRAADTGSPGGTSEGCTAFTDWKNGGYGYGSGGSSSDVGGGGGGYSGGGKGGTTGGGGGGGSYVDAMRLSQSGSDGATTASPGDGTASYQVIPRPDNDLCPGARTLTCGSSSTGNTEFATADDAPSNCATSSNVEGVWFKFVGTGDVMVLSTVGVSGYFDTQINVYTGSCGNLSCVGGNDDNDVETFLSRYEFCSVKNATYYVYLDGFGGATGPYQINLNCSYTNPMISCPTGPTVTPTDAVACTSVVNNLTATFSDNCPNPLLSYTTTGATTLSGNGQISGQTFNSGFTNVIYKVTDGAGQMAFCSFTVRVNPCISGSILWSDDKTTGVKSAVVTVTGDASGSSITDVNGNYSLTLMGGANFVVTPSKNINKLNGVNAQDVWRIIQHAATNPIPIADPYKLIAADVDNNNVITTFDANIIQLSILGNPQALAQFIKSWRFVPKTYVLPNPPWGFPESISIVNTPGKSANVGFYGIKIGDVVPISANPANVNAEPAFVLTASDRVLQAGEALSVDFQAGQTDDLAAFQFGLHFDPSSLKLMEVQSLTALPLSDSNFGLQGVDDGAINMLWAAGLKTDVPEAAPVFRLTFQALTSGAQLSDLLYLNEDELPARAYKGNLAESNVVLHFLGVSGTSNPGAGQPRLQLLQNQPNPFSDRTQIGFELPAACTAQLRIFDASGRVVALQNKQYAAGKHSEVFEIEQVSGVLYYDLTTPFGVLSKKMVVVKE